MIPNDDWRLRVHVHEHGFAHALGERLAAADLVHDLRKTFAERIAVSVDGAEVFCYTSTREQAESALALIAGMASGSGWQLDSELMRWHPSSQQWEDADVPLPQTDADELAEHRQRIAAQRAESAAQGYPEYEVRVQAADRHGASRLVEALAQRGVAAEQRHHYLLIGADDEDAARQLADTVRGVAGPDLAVSVQATGRAIQDGMPPNPFAVFGGLAG